MSREKRVPTHDDVQMAIEILNLVVNTGDSAAVDRASREASAIQRAWLASLDLGEADATSV